MKTVICDIETDSLDPKYLWCIVAKEEGSNSHLIWDVTTGYEDFKEYAKTVDRWVFHNGISFDMPVINKLVGHCIDFNKVFDTFVVSRTVNYPYFNGHGLDEIGTFLGKRKTEFHDFSRYTKKMLEYCKDDVDVGLLIYNRYKKYADDPQWTKALEIEHRTAFLCHTMHKNGFKFDRKLALEVLPEIKQKIKNLEERMQLAWPPELQVVNTLKYRMKADGSLFATTANAMENYPKTEVSGEDLLCYDYVSFNPGSSKDRVEKLWAAGWNPTEKTKSHYKFDMQATVGEFWGKTRLTHESYEKKKEHFSFYGWTVSDENLSTLPEDAPQSARDLAEWLCLNGRLKALEERLRECEEDDRIRTSFWHIGAWTHRMAHSSPNLANISSPFHGEPRTAVDLVKQKYDGQLRKMFTVDEGNYLVGTDAESIQLRVLAHYLKNEDYIEAITKGKKENETDIHNLNKRALGLNHLTRDNAKTFKK